MRLFVSIAVLGLVSASVSAMAQTNTTTTTGGQNGSQPVYAVPMYNAPTGGTYYQPGVSGSVYNNSTTAQPMPMNQMVAGKNAPSYNYNANKPYTGFSSGNPMAGADLANLTPEQSQYLRSQQEAIARQQQEAYMRGMPAVNQPLGQANPYMQGANQMYNQFMQPEQQKPKQRRVVYNERNNPLVTPPRLFNPDR